MDTPGLEKSLHAIFSIVHMTGLFLGGYYFMSGNNSNALFFMSVSVMGLLYMVMYISLTISRREQAHLNMIQDKLDEEEEVEQ